MANSNRRSLFKTALSFGAASVFAGVGARAVAQEACDPVNCDPFPFVGDKESYSRDEFNSIAQGIADATLDSIRKGGAAPSKTEEDAIRKATRESLERLFSKYYDLG